MCCQETLYFQWGVTWILDQTETKRAFTSFLYALWHQSCLHARSTSSRARAKKTRLTAGTLFSGSAIIQVSAVCQALLVWCGMVSLTSFLESGVKFNIDLKVWTLNSKQPALYHVGRSLMRSLPAELWKS